MKIRHLINNNGSPFASSEIQMLGSQLDALNDDKRRGYRDNNASAIAKHNADKTLIISGQGTG